MQKQPIAVEFLTELNKMINLPDAPVGLGEVNAKVKILCILLKDYVQDTEQRLKHLERSAP